MTWIDGLLIFIALLLIYFSFIIYLKRKDLLEKYHLGLMGPFLLIKTKKGIGFLKKLSKNKRFWIAYGNVAIIICFIIMIIMVIFFIWQLNFLFEIPAEQRGNLPGPEFALVLPGINPILPIDYLFFVILALIIAMVVHEFSHGILTFVSDLKVKSMGLTFLIIPMGAFVEPDEEGLMKTKVTKRMRLFAVGPMANLVVALVCLLLFSFVFMGSLQAAADGVVIVSISEDSPAEEYGFEPGMLITSINGTKTSDYYDFFYAMNDTQSGKEVEIEYYWNGIKTKMVNLSDKYEEYEVRYPTLNNKSFIGKGFFGMGPGLEDAYLAILQNPFGSHIKDRFFILFSLPVSGYFDGYNPIIHPFTESYKVTGPLSILPESVFWFMVNAIYWIFWLNLLVGIFNVIPMKPLDGGYLFTDNIKWVVKKIKKDVSDEKLDKTVGNVSIAVSLILLFLIISPFFFKYL